MSVNKCNVYVSGTRHLFVLFVSSTDFTVETDTISKAASLCHKLHSFNTSFAPKKGERLSPNFSLQRVSFCQREGV